MSLRVSRVVQQSGQTGPEEPVGRFNSLEDVQSRFKIELRPLGGGEYTGTDVANGIIYIVMED